MSKHRIAALAVLLATATASAFGAAPASASALPTAPPGVGAQDGGGGFGATQGCLTCVAVGAGMTVLSMIGVPVWGWFLRNPKHAVATALTCVAACAAAVGAIR